MNNNKVVHLEVSSYIGISLGATHFYGKLVREDGQGQLETVYLMRKLTARDATEMNKSDPDRTWRAGQSYDGYNTTQDIIDQALAEYKQYFPGATVLLLGKYVFYTPKIVLDGPESLKKEAAYLVESVERLGTDQDQKAMKLAKRFEDAVDRVVKGCK